MFTNIIDFNYNEILAVIIRALTSLITLFLITKLIGRKQVSELSLFDYVIGISIGNFAAEATMNLDINLSNGIVSVLIFGFVAYFVSIATMKSICLRRFFIGVPTVIIQNGKIIENSLKKVKFDINDLLEECRINGYFDISEIEYALMEANGKISFLPKGENKPVTLKDMNIKPDKQCLCSNVIIDGNIMKNNLNNSGKDESWLSKELRVKGYKSIDNILLATLDINEKLVIYEKNNDLEIKNVLE